MSAFHKSIALLLSAALSGCGGGSDLVLGEVEGVVTLDGKPLPNAVVTFAPKGGGPAGVGKTNAEGEYQLMTAGQPGAVPGEHTVSIICVPEPAPVEAASSHDQADGGISTASEDYEPPEVTEVPARYNTETELTEEVKSGGNTINFDLKS